MPAIKWRIGTEVAGKVLLDEALVFSPGKSKDMDALDEALNQLELLFPHQSRVVEVRFFGGLEMEEIAEIAEVKDYL